MSHVRRSRTDAPLSSLTTLEAEVEGKMRKGEEEERLETLGQESDLKAAPWVSKDLEMREEAEKRQWEEDLLILQQLRKHSKKTPYFRYLTHILLRFTAEEAIPKKYRIEVEINNAGIIVKIAGTKYIGAFKPSGLVSYDQRYCKILAMKLGNTVAKLEGYRRKSEGGIVLPDEEDLRVYG